MRVLLRFLCHTDKKYVLSTRKQSKGNPPLYNGRETKRRAARVGKVRRIAGGGGTEVLMHAKSVCQPRADGLASMLII